MNIKEVFWVENQNKTKKNLVYSLAFNTNDLRTEIERTITEIFEFSRALEQLYSYKKAPSLNSKLPVLSRNQIKDLFIHEKYDQIHKLIHEFFTQIIQNDLHLNVEFCLFADLPEVIEESYLQEYQEAVKIDQSFEHPIRELPPKSIDNVSLDSLDFQKLAEL